MNTLEQLYDMTEHPERYTDADFGSTEVTDEMIDREWKRFEQKHFGTRREHRTRVAAAIAGVLLASSIVYAVAIRPTVRGRAEAVVTIPADTVQKTPLPSPSVTKTEPRVFENVELQQILDEITPYYNIRSVSYQRPELMHLRLYYEWNPQNPLREVAKQLSAFEQLTVSIMDSQQLYVE